MLESARDPRIAGFTTNPTLMRKAGVADYRAFAREVLAADPRQADLVRGVRRRHREHAPAGAGDRDLGRQRLREDPGHQHRGRAVDRGSSASWRARGVKLNVTAICTLDQVRDGRAGRSAGGAPSVVSVFAGPHRRHRPRSDPADARGARRSAAPPIARIELLWASPREVLNIVQADEIGCDIITVTPDLLRQAGALRQGSGRRSAWRRCRCSTATREAAGYKL